MKLQKEETADRHTIQLRGSWLKHPKDFHAAEPIQERKSPLYLKPTQEMLEEAMRRLLAQQKEPALRGPRKPQFIDALQPTTSQQISALMESPVTITVEDILWNMPEV
jgi:hypothetical protein